MSDAARVRMAHGSGGAAMRDLIREVFVCGLGSEAAAGDVGLAQMDDGAALRVGDRHLVFTTDAHVVAPIFFPGGDIGRLSVCGTVNDLAMMGATDPIALSLSVVVEDGFPRADLDRVRDSLRDACREAETRIVTGDTKVMGRGQIDGLILHTSGIGFTDRVITDAGLRPGDRLIVTGTIGDHGFAVMTARHRLDLEGDLRSDVAPLNGLVRAAIAAGGDALVAMKDPTRGGLGSALHEMAEKSGVGVIVDEPAVPVRREVRAAAELLGVDPLLVANEGKAVIGVRPRAAGAVLAALRAHPLGRDAAVIGEAVADRPGSVVLDTGFGRRLLAEIEGDLLPRIC